MKLAFRLSSLSAVLVLAPLALAQQPAPRAITIDDYFQIREVRDPQLSPDAKWVAYSIKTVLLKEDKEEERIWMAPTAGGDPLALTAEGVSSAHARWRPDGKFLAFLSARDEGKTQVWLLNRLGGDAERLTDTPQDVQDFAWSPDRDAASDQNIWLVPASNSNKRAPPRLVTTDPGADGSPAWPPDGEWIAYVMQMEPHLFYFATRHLAVAPATGGEAKLITHA